MDTKTRATIEDLYKVEGKAEVVWLAADGNRLRAHDKQPSDAGHSASARA